MDNSSQEHGQSRSRLPLTAILTVASVIVTNLITGSLAVGTRSSQLDALTKQVGELAVIVKELAMQYTHTDKDVSNELQKIQDHLVYEDIRLDKIETQHQSQGVK